MSYESLTFLAVVMRLWSQLQLVWNCIVEHDRHSHPKLVALRLPPPVVHSETNTHVSTYRTEKGVESPCRSFNREDYARLCPSYKDPRCL